MARGTSSYLNTAGIACKCFATATAPTFAPSAAKAQATGSSPLPAGIAVDGEGKVAVFDYGNARVQVFRLSDGAYVRTIGSKGRGNGQFNLPYGGIAIDSDGRMVVADYGNHRVQVLE